MVEQAIELAENLSIKTSEIKSKIKENQIFVGAKPFMRYVRSCEILLRNKNLKTISIRARGLNICKAVDLSLAIKNKFCSDLKLNLSVSVSTEMFAKDNRDFSVSVVELVLRR